MQKSVLLVTPYFAPQSHAAMFRAYKLAKYLPAFGWKPIVVTTDANYLYREDPSLLPALPAEVEVHQARYIEPTLRGLRRLQGSAPSPVSTAPSAPAAEKRARRAVGARPSVLRRAYQYVLDRWVQVPDALWTWRQPALKTAWALVQQHNIRVVYTTSPPYTPLEIGRALQRRGCRWLADFRDPSGCQQRTCSRFPAVAARQRQIVADALAAADFVTGASSSHDLLFCDFFGRLRTDPVRFIPTGLDEQLLTAPETTTVPAKPYFIYVGEFLSENEPLFFEVFARAHQDSAFRTLGVKLLIVGNLQINRPLVQPIIERLGLTEYVELREHLPQQELYGLIRHAQAGVLLSGRSAFWHTLFAKLVDYLALRKPVLAVLPSVSESRVRLERAGLGIFLDGPVEECAAQLVDLATGRIPVPTPNEEECARFTARRQVGAFVELFAELSERAR